MELLNLLKDLLPLINLILIPIYKMIANIKKDIHDLKVKTEVQNVKLNSFEFLLDEHKKDTKRHK